MVDEHLGRPIAEYTTSQTEPEDFDAFWASTISDARRHDLAVELTPHPTRLTTLDVYDVAFTGFGGDRVRAWLRIPRGAGRPLPGIVQFTGYGNGRGHALRDLRWASAGYAHLVVDARGQMHGETDDPHTATPSSGEFITRGIGSPQTYYYRRVYTDAVRAVDALRGIDGVDEARIGAIGLSQGGGIALAMAGLVEGLVGVSVQAPALAELNRAALLSPVRPYSVLAEHFADRRLDADRSLNTLRYFDVVNHAKRATAPALFSTGLRDGITPPETVLPAYNAYSGEKRLVLWPYNGHEAGGEHDEENALEFFAERMSASADQTHHTHDAGSGLGAPTPE